MPNNISGSRTGGVNTGDVRLANIGSSANAAGASISNQVLNLQPASGSFGGVVTTGNQTFAGIKTFTQVNCPLIATTSGDLTLTPQANISAAGKQITCSSVVYGSGGSSLDYHEAAATHTLSLSGPFNATTVPCRVSRTGGTVNLELGSTSTIAGNSTAAFISSSGATFLPSKWRPSAEITVLTYVQEDTSNVQAILRIYTTGEIRLFKYNSSPASNTFISTTGNFIIHRISISYNVA